MPSERVAISNINQFVGYAKKYPALLSIGGFASLRGYVTVGDECNTCSRKQNLLQEMRPTFEASFAVLTPGEQQRMKTILDTNRVCYYTKLPNGQLKSTCF
jgi:hypothetical protein